MTDRTKIDNASQYPARIPNGGDAVSATRRRLVKGSAVAVPVVLTLRSGAAAALASHQDCVLKDRNNAANGAVRDADMVIATGDGEQIPGPYVYGTLPALKVKEKGKHGKVVWFYHENMPGGDNKIHTEDDDIVCIAVTEDGEDDDKDDDEEEEDNEDSGFSTVITDFTSLSVGQKIRVTTDTTCSIGKKHTHKVKAIETSEVMLGVNNEGDIIGYGKNSAPNFITYSCWCSINPHINVP